ncbi:MAG: TerC family protein [Chitinophagaceae bacterium]|nr:TerC family protein [Chitinophagaceae bacterium]
MEYLFTSESLISFFILVVLEVVLGIDNVIFVSIILNRLKGKKEQSKARRFWMIAGILMRSLLLMGLGWLLAQKGKAVFTIGGKGFDLASIVMLAGGLFLIYKSVMEIHHKLEGEDPNEALKQQKPLSFGRAIGQILLIDAVFSFDSIITAGGTAKHVEIMIAAVVIAMTIMFLFSPKISGFIHKHPTLKMLALSFLVMIGLSLIIEGWDAEAAHQLHLKNYIYFGMAFSFIVEMLNMTMMSRAKKKKAHVVQLNEPVLREESENLSDQAK